MRKTSALPGLTGGRRERISPWGRARQRKAFEAWKDSPGHRANMLNPSFEEMGGGHAEEGMQPDLWVQDAFRARRYFIDRSQYGYTGVGLVDHARRID